MDKSALWLTFPPKYTKSFVYSGIPFARKHMISGLAFDTVRLNAVHTTTITPIIFLSCSGDLETRLVQRLGEGGGDATDLSHFWEETARQ